jgi:hypothetical protein
MKQQMSAGLAAQQAIAHAQMVMATDSSNYHIVPIEGHSKKYSSLNSARYNFAGAGQ